MTYRAHATGIRRSEVRRRRRRELRAVRRVLVLPPREVELMADRLRELRESRDLREAGE